MSATQTQAQKTPTEKVILVKVTPSVHKELKILCVTDGLVMQEFATEAVLEHMARYKKSRRRQSA